MSETESETLQDILRKRRRSAIRNGLIVLLLIGGGVAYWWFSGRPESEPPAPPRPEIARREPAPPPVPPPPPAREPAPKPPVREPAPMPPPLPELDESDSFTRNVVSALTKRPEVVTWLATDELIRRFVAAVDSVAEGRTPKEQLGTLQPETGYTVLVEAEQTVTDPISFERYDTVTDVIIGIDSRGAAAAYRKLRPLIDEAYRDLGYPERSFDEALQGAIAELLRAPVIVGDPALTPLVITHAYSDPELEGLSSAQKQLLRLGPVNAPRIQRKLRELALSLGIPDNELPLTPLYQVPALPPESAMPAESETAGSAP